MNLIIDEDKKGIEKMLLEQGAAELKEKLQTITLDLATGELPAAELEEKLQAISLDFSNGEPQTVVTKISSPVLAQWIVNTPSCDGTWTDNTDYYYEKTTFGVPVVKETLLGTKILCDKCGRQVFFIPEGQAVAPPVYKCTHCNRNLSESNRTAPINFINAFLGCDEGVTTHY